jgi:DNA-binding response OmpR family regulator
MSVMILEDNFLVAEMIRLAVEDAHLTPLEPARTLNDGRALLGAPDLDGAVLDIQIGGDHSFPIARALKLTNVPFIFVSGYDRTILPDDLGSEILVRKPVLVGDLAQLAAERFGRTPQAVHSDPAGRLTRAGRLGDRIAQAEGRILRQRRRLERLQIEGRDSASTRLAADLLDQMEIAAALMRQTLHLVEEAVSAPASRIERPISDEVVDPEDAESVLVWSTQLGITPEALLKLIREVGSSGHLLRRAAGLIPFDGPARRSFE